MQATVPKQAAQWVGLCLAPQETVQLQLMKPAEACLEAPLLLELRQRSVCWYLHHAGHVHSYCVLAAAQVSLFRAVLICKGTIG